MSKNAKNMQKTEQEKKKIKSNIGHMGKILTSCLILMKFSECDDFHQDRIENLEFLLFLLALNRVEVIQY